LFVKGYLKAYTFLKHGESNKAVKHEVVAFWKRFKKKNVANVAMHHSL
jgi:hypothetical protein